MMFQTYHALLFLFCAACLLVFHNFYRRHTIINQSIQQHVSPIRLTTTLPPSRTQPSDSPSLPSPLSNLYHLQRSSPNAEFFRNYPYSRPLALATYIRDVDNRPALVELSFVLTGVSLAKYQRNLTAVACRVGDTLFASDLFRNDFLRCHVNRTALQPGAPLAPVLLLDTVLRRALQGPVELKLELIATLEPGDVTPLPPSVRLHPQLQALGRTRDNLMQVRSPHVFDTQYDRYAPADAARTPRYEMCLMTQIKPSTYLLRDWIDYHRRVGVDMVYVFDNHADEDLARTYAARRDVEVVYWPFDRAQVQALVWSMLALRRRCEWVLGLDADEFVMLGLGPGDAFATASRRPLKRYVEWLGGRFDEISFQWVAMRNSHYVERPARPVPEAYVHRFTNAKVRPLRKTAARTDRDWVGASPHYRVAARKHRRFQDKGRDAFPRRPADAAMVVHFLYRSWRDYQEKVRAGRANIMNQRSVSSIEAMRALGDEKNREAYMRAQRQHSERYTHFRDIWRRVVARLSDDESVVAWTDADGRACRATFVNGGAGGAGRAASHKGTACEG